MHHQRKCRFYLEGLQVAVDWSDEVTETNRGAKGFGSSDSNGNAIKADTVNLILSDITGGTADASGTIDLSGLTSADTVSVSGGISSADKTAVETKLNAGIDSGHDGKAKISFDYDTSGSSITVEYDNLIDNTLDFTATYDFIS